MKIREKFKVPYKISDDWFYNWASEIPDDWDVKRGKYILSHKKEINDLYQCDLVLALTLNGVMHKDDLEMRSLVPSDYATYQIFNNGDLVFKLIDLENYQTSRVGIVAERGIMSSAYIRIVSSSGMCPKFFYYYYFSLYLQGIFNFLGMGVRSTLNQQDLLNIPVLIPPLTTQEKIAKYLDRCLGQMVSLEKASKTNFTLIREYRESLIYYIVTGKLQI